MYKIDQLTDDTVQSQTLVLNDGTYLTLRIKFVPMQFGWFITEVSYGASIAKNLQVMNTPSALPEFVPIVEPKFMLRGVRIVTSPNILYQYKNEIPFGLACYTKDNAEPSLQQDFAPGGRCTLYLLDEAEVLALSEIIRGQN